MGRWHKKITGREMTGAKDHPRIVSGLLGVFPFATLCALWDIWYRAGSWSKWARDKFYALEAFSHAAPDLADHPDFSRLKKSYQGA